MLHPYLYGFMNGRNAGHAPSVPHRLGVKSMAGAHDALMKRARKMCDSKEYLSGPPAQHA
jgi:hypothetical protein